MSTGNNASNVNTVAINGLGFREVYLILRKQFAVNCSIGSYEKGLSIVVPMLVNGAFACELLLKSLNPSLNRGHKLKTELFDKLKDTTKQDIINRFIVKSKNTYDETTFNSDFIKNEELFVDWRYFHEKSNHASLGFLDLLIQTLYDFMKDNNIFEDSSPDY